MFYLFGLIAAITAICLASGRWLSWLLIWVSLAIILVTGFLSYRQKPQLLPYLLISLATLALAVRTVFILPPASFQPSHLNHQSVKLTGRVVNNPTNQTKSMTVILDQVSIQQPSQPWYGKVQINAPFYTPVAYGDTVKVSGSFNSSLPAQTDYQTYQINHQIYGSLAWPQVEVVSHGQGNPVVSASLWLQQRCEQAVVRWLPKDESGLLLGIVAGLPEPISDTFSQALNRTSTTHIIVASGYNATIIITAVFAATSSLKRRASILIVLAILAGYVALSGFNPSMIRAAIMASIAILAQVAGRQKMAMHILLLTGAAMLLLNPLWIFDTSWQLSFAATIGIIKLEPIISSIIGNRLSRFKEVVSTTLAAQLATLPIIGATFGTVTLVGLAANFLVLWLVPWVMLVGAIAIPLLIVLPWLGSLVAWVLEPGLWYIKQTIELIASLPAASVNIQLSLVFCLVYYVALVILVWRMPSHEAAAT